jgi:hypothetical protein
MYIHVDSPVRLPDGRIFTLRFILDGWCATIGTGRQQDCQQIVPVWDLPAVMAQYGFVNTDVPIVEEPVREPVNAAPERWPGHIVMPFGQ